MPDSSGLENVLLVFTVPAQQITFYADDPSSYKQVLTIKNPYDFLCKFRILVSSADSEKYTIVPAPQGYIKPNHFVEVIIYLKSVIPANIGVSDRVRVHLIRTGTHKVSGKKDLTTTLLATSKEKLAHEAEGGFRHFEEDLSFRGHLRQQPYGPQNGSRNLIICIVAIILGIILLAMPKEGDDSQYFPDIIPRPTYEFRLIVAFVLGAITVIIFQT